MKQHSLSRRQFIQRSALAATALSFAQPAFSASVTRRTATDQVTLGNTGIKLSRLGMGTGSNNGAGQMANGREAFNSLVRYAYDQGITYFDCAKAYRTFDWIGQAIKPLPREKLFIQSKVMGSPQDVLATIDGHRKTLNTDYVDSLLIHLMTQPGWTESDNYKRVMDAFNTAQEKKWIRAKGVSCHSLPALRTAIASTWTQVHLVRVNPQGKHTDNEDTHDRWDSNSRPIEPVVAELKKMQAEGRGVIGMKIMGNGEFRTPEDREKSIRYAMSRPELNAVVIGFTNRAEIDEAIKRM